MSFTLKHLEELQKQGKIKGFSATTKPEKLQDPAIKNVKKGSKTKDWIHLNLEAWCKANSLEMQVEQRFHVERKWRFDWSLPSLKVAIEYEGLMSKKSRHTTISGFTGDTEKYTQAALLGWKVMRYTAKNYKNLIDDLNKLL